MEKQTANGASCEGTQGRKGKRGPCAKKLNARAEEQRGEGDEEQESKSFLAGSSRRQEGQGPAAGPRAGADVRGVSVSKKKTCKP
eukprot:scaffold20356_cov125-Isochrysis_galbana.AAC.15